MNGITLTITPHGVAVVFLLIFGTLFGILGVALLSVALMDDDSGRAWNFGAALVLLPIALLTLWAGMNL